MSGKIDTRELEEKIVELEKTIKRLQKTESRLLKENSELKEIKKYFDVLMQNTEDFILICDSNGVPRAFNASYKKVVESLLGIEMEPGIQPFKISERAKAGEYWASLQMRALNGEKFVAEYCDDEREGYFETIFFPVKEGEKVTGFTEITRNISDRKKAEKEKKVLQEKLQRSQTMESLGLLAGGVAHDLNNVLAGIVSYPDLILSDMSEDNSMRKPLETIKKAGDRATAIVQDLLTIARGVATEKNTISINDLINEYLGSPEFEKLQQYHPLVTIKTDLESNLLNIKGSYIHLRKVLMNLVANASEAIEGRGDITISTKNCFLDTPVKAYDHVAVGEYAVISVSDTGTGIPHENLKRIFEPFYTKKVMGRSGTGLGLAVVWNVMREHNGYINVTSEKKCTVFELYLPITREDLSAYDSGVPLEEIKGNGQKILIVDDVESQREICGQILEKLGYNVYTVAGGEEAVEYLKENSVDLILLDMIMDPGINGLETYKRIIKIHPHQKAVLTSGYAATDEVKKTQELGAGALIKKPVTLQRLGVAIREELEKTGNTV